MKLTCHCGNIEITASHVPQEVAHCNCSICRRYATAWAYYEPEDLQVAFKKEASVYYLWGDKEVEFHRCNLCGCVTHYKTTSKCDVNKMAVNMRLMDTQQLETIPVRKIDGAAY